MVEMTIAVCRFGLVGIVCLLAMLAAILVLVLICGYYAKKGISMKVLLKAIGVKIKTSKLK